MKIQLNELDDVIEALNDKCWLNLVKIDTDEGEQKDIQVRDLQEVMKYMMDKIRGLEADLDLQVEITMKVTSLDKLKKTTYYNYRKIYPEYFKDYRDVN